MTEQSDVARGHAVVERWCLLAEQRLDYLTELFESGRWRRFHSELEFLENIQDAKRAVDTWRGLLTAEAAADNRPIDLSWLGGNSHLGPRRRTIMTDEPQRAMPRPFELPVEEAPPVAPVDSLAGSRAAAKQASAQSWDALLDVTQMQQRYPLLRPTF